MWKRNKHGGRFRIELIESKASQLKLNLKYCSDVSGMNKNNSQVQVKKSVLFY